MCHSQKLDRTSFDMVIHIMATTGDILWDQQLRGGFMPFVTDYT